MALFGRTRGAGDDGDGAGDPRYRRSQPSTEPPRTASVDLAAPGADEPSLDTVGNPIVERLRSGARHAAPEAGPTRAERRMLEFVVAGRIARTVAGGSAAGFWRIDGAFATGTKAMMLDWLLAEGFLAIGPRERVAAPAVLTDLGRAVLAEG